jgi:hypothetical protein
MSKTIWVAVDFDQLLQKKPADYGAQLTVDGVNVWEKYGLEFGFGDPGENPNYDTFDYSEWKITGISTTNPGTVDLTYQTEGLNGTTTTWHYSRWHSVVVSDSYQIPTDLDVSGLIGPVHWTTSNHTSIDFGPLSFDGSHLTISGYPISQIKDWMISNAQTYVENGMKAAGFGGLLTSLKNVQAVSDFFATGPVKAVDQLSGLINAGTSNYTDPAQLAAIEQQIFGGISSSLNNAFNSAVLVPGNTKADALAHDLIRSIGLVGEGVTINGGIQIDLKIGLGYGLTLTTGANVDFSFAVGGTGDQTVVGQAPRNFFFLGDGNDTATGADGTFNYISGGGGTNVINIGNSSNIVIGGSGDDTVIFAQPMANFSQNVFATGSFGTLNLIDSASHGDRLVQVDRIKFSDGTVYMNTSTPLIDPFYYDQHNHDVLSANVPSDTHYETYGWKEGRDPDPFFSTSGYLASNPDVGAAGVNPLDHYDASGWKEGRDPSANFDTTLYLLHNPDVAAAGVDPLVHYLRYGQYENRAAYAAVGSNIGANGFDAEYYLLANPDVAPDAARSGDPNGFALQHFETYGWKEGRNPNAWFDVNFYLQSNPDVKAAGVNPLQHYISYGADEGRDPSANFDTDNYLLVNADVAAAHVNPLVHFLDYGIYEGRDPMPETYLNISFSGPNGQHLLVETQPNIWIEDNHYVFNELGESDYGLLLHDYARGVEIQIRFGTGQVSEYQPLETDQYSVTSVTEYGKPHIPEGWIV